MRIAVTNAIKERRKALSQLRAMAKGFVIDTEQLYCAMENIPLFGNDTLEDFGNLRSVAAQVRMIYDEAASILGAEKGFALAAEAVEAARRY